MAEDILGGDFKAGDTIRATVKDDHLSFKTVEKAEKKEAAASINSSGTPRSIRPKALSKKGSPSITREFGIPAEATIDRDTSGQKLKFLPGDKIVIEVLSTPFEKRKLIFLNQTKTSVKIRK